MAVLQKIVDEYITLAQKAPDASLVLREAASHFARLAMDPKNARSSAGLGTLAFDFAAAAQKRARRPTTEDFTDLLEETQATVNEIGDADAMNTIARRREIHDERSFESPKISIAPATWTEDSTLGRMAQIKFDPTEDEKNQGIVPTQTVAFWQGTKKEAQAITIDAGLVSPPAPTGGHPTLLAQTICVRTYVIVEYGSDGDKRSVKFDLAFGRRLTVVGNYVSVLVGCDPPRTLLAGPPAVIQPTEPVTVGASIGTFAAPSQAPVIGTAIVEGLIATGTSDFVQIPVKSVQLLPMQTNLNLGEVATILWYAYGGGNTPLTQSFYQQSAIAASSIPLPRDAAFFKITNGGAGTGNFYLPFQLSL